MKNFFKKLIKSLFNDESKELNASNAYLISRYGKVLKEEQIVDALLNDIIVDIREKSRRGMYTLSIDITTRNEEFIDQIKKYFTDRNFKVWIITQDVIKDLDDRGVVLLSWRKSQITKFD